MGQALLGAQTLDLFDLGLDPDEVNGDCPHQRVELLLTRLNRGCDAYGGCLCHVLDIL
jgi:hypothetical protein